MISDTLVIHIGQRNFYFKEIALVFQDRTLVCTECGDEFIFSIDDQQYHLEKGYTNEPKRCIDCRRARRASYNRGGGFGGGGGGFGGGSSRPTYAITCAECGKEDEVPFRPTGARPVYCYDCFRSGASRN